MITTKVIKGMAKAAMKWAPILLARNTMLEKETRRMFWTGWRRQSAVILDAVGCPPWLVSWRCPSEVNWLYTVTNDEYDDRHLRS